MLYLSAGHNPRGLHPDPGAVGNGYKEADLAVELRNLTIGALQCMGAKYTTDRDDERLAEYLKRIQTGSGSVVCDIHFNAGPPTANGIEVLIPIDNTPKEYALAKQICDSGATICRLTNRGVKTEAQSHHGRLGIMRESGLNVLLEMCFITNTSDLAKYQASKAAFAAQLAFILKEYDDLV